jgi:hypothetical protein
MHENFLDIKPFMQKNEEKSGGEGMGRRLSPPKRAVKTKEALERDRELEQKARYKLRENENG